MKKYNKPNFEVVEFAVEDIITASNLINGGDNGSVGGEGSANGDITDFGAGSAEIYTDLDTYKR